MDRKDVYRSEQESKSKTPLDRIPELLRQGNKVEAIIVYRQHYPVGLKEAKDAIDQLEIEVKRANPR
jgi:ribosomal protein L7/L12